MTMISIQQFFFIFSCIYDRKSLISIFIFLRKHFIYACIHNVQAFRLNFCVLLIRTFTKDFCHVLNAD